VYAGTGEANFRGDAYAGAGLLLSQDGGSHWAMLNNSFAKTAFSRIRVDPSNLNNLAVATARSGGGIGEESSGTGNVPGSPPRGVFISNNGGVGFTQVLFGEATALEANPNNFCQQYAGLGEIYGELTNGVYRTTNCWQTSELIQGPWPPLSTNITYTYTNYIIGTNSYFYCTNNVCYTNYYAVYTNEPIATNITLSLTEGRIVMASSPSDPNTLYVGIAHTRSRYTASLYGIWVTHNAWAPVPTWTDLPAPSTFKDNVSTPRYWYMFDLLVEPSNPDVVYLAEFNVWRFQSGTWTDVATWNPDNVHPDNHVMAWVSGTVPPKMLLGNDGGLYFSDAGVTGNWSSLNDGLRITQFYKGAVDPSGLHVLALGGAQDEFTSLYNGALDWPAVDSGDGGDCAISATDPLNAWATSADTPTDNPTGSFSPGQKFPMLRVISTTSFRSPNNSMSTLKKRPSMMICLLPAPPGSGAATTSLAAFLPGLPIALPCSELATHPSPSVQWPLPPPLITEWFTPLAQKTGSCGSLPTGA
jgi:hypothetical protein